MEENKRKPSIEASKTKENISQNDDVCLKIIIQFSPKNKKRKTYDKVTVFISMC